MRAPTLLLTVVLAAGCAGRGAQPPAVTPVPAVPVVAELEAECRRAASRAVDGEHRPAVELFDSLAAAAADCSEEVRRTVAESRRRLSAADDLARRGLEARDGGDLAAAAVSFDQALAEYPKYYWVQKLRADLAIDPEREIRALRQAAGEHRAAGRWREALELLEEAASYSAAGPEVAAEMAAIRNDVAMSRLEDAGRAQQGGDVSRAIESTRQAIAVEPADPARSQVIEFARRLGLGLYSAGELVAARDLWAAALALDPVNTSLREYLDEVADRLRSLDAIKGDGDGA